MSIPNLLALSRLALTPIAMYLILISPGNRTYMIVGTVVFVVAALTDLADGYLARRWEITTTLGAFLDTMADKVLVTGALIALVEIHSTSSWLAFIIIAREISIMGLRAVAALGRSTVPPSIWGKLKAAIQFTAISFAIIRFDVVFSGWRLDQWFMFVALVVTILSAIDYLLRFRSVFNSDDRSS